MSSLPSSSSSLPSSRLATIIRRYQDQLERMDALETRLDTRTTLTRRRIEGLGIPTHRQSHLRLFCTHTYKVSDDKQEEYALQMEGRLLIDHLDHAAAAAYDEKIGYTPPTDDLDRSRGEEEEPLKRIHFTHFFDKCQVTFQTVYQPPLSAATVSPKKKKTKKSRRSGGAAASQEVEADPRTFLLSNASDTVEWNQQDTEDAHAWSVPYTPPAAPAPTYSVHSVVAYISLVPTTASSRMAAAAAKQQQQQQQQNTYSSSRMGGNPRVYKVKSPELARAFFPHHGPPTQEPPRPAKRKADQALASNVTTMTTADGFPLPPADSQITLPASLTLQEIASAMFVYIYDKRLVDETDKHIIVCDDLLQSLLQTDRLPFSQLHTTLVQKGLIQAVSGEEAVELVYVMDAVSATNFGSQDASTLQTGDATTTEAAAGLASPPTEPLLHQPSLLQLDMDCDVPLLFGPRARDLLRRIKRRELEYTSSRTKARYLLTARRASNDEDNKNKIQQAVSLQSLETYLEPVHLALAKAAPPHTQARQAALLDARTSLLLERVEQAHQAAQQAWQVVDQCRRLAGETTGSE